MILAKNNFIEDIKCYLWWCRFNGDLTKMFDDIQKKPW